MVIGRNRFLKNMFSRIEILFWRDDFIDSEKSLAIKTILGGLIVFHANQNRKFLRWIFKGSHKSSYTKLILSSYIV